MRTHFRRKCLIGLEKMDLSVSQWWNSKGGRYALDHFCYSFDFVVVGIGQWLHDWRIHSCPPGDRHRRGLDPDHPGPKTIVVILIDFV